MSKTVPFQTIQFSISTQFICQTVLFQVIQFIISTQFSSIWPMDRTLSRATSPGQSEPGSDSNKGVLHITGTSPSDCLMLYIRTLVWGGLTPLQRCSRCNLLGNKQNLTGLNSRGYLCYIKCKLPCLEFELRLSCTFPKTVTITPWMQWASSPTSEAASHLSKMTSISYLPTPPLGQDMTQGQFLSGV